MILTGTGLISLLLAGCLATLGTAASGQPAPSSPSETVETLILRASSAEQACRTNEAIEVYERLLNRDTTYEAIVAPRLVNLYIACGQALPALTWASRVSRRHPEQKAYLAAVYARLGQMKESELVLREALRDTRAPHQRITLLWQLADVQESQGDSGAALATLSAAQNTAPDNRLRETSAQRLDALRRRNTAARATRSHNLGETKVEVTPCE